MIAWRKLPLAMGALVALAASGMARADGIGGTWTGSYVCSQGTTALTLTIEAASLPAVTAIFAFSAVAANPLVPAGCFEMSGTYAADTGALALNAGRWLRQPFGYATVDLSGTLAPGGQVIGGTVLFPGCTTFELHRAGGPRAVPDICLPGLVSSLTPRSARA
jgi:hypothetical protein